MKDKKRNHSSLEREVITAVTILYLLIMGALLAIHYMQPAGQETTTSSPSPTHAPENRPVKKPEARHER
jgi:hypothetical protein